MTCSVIRVSLLSSVFHPNMELFSAYFWVFLSNLTQTLFGFFTRYYSPEATSKDCSSTFSTERYQIGTNSDNVGLQEEEEPPKLVFKFQYQSWNYGEELNAGYSESYDFERDLVPESVKKEEMEEKVKAKPENFGDQEKKLIDCSDELSAKPNLQNSTVLDLEYSISKTLRKHLDLVQVKQVKKVSLRATGLPTILEDSESPRIMEDLKPWKNNEKFQHSTIINELPKFYRCYRERMRKFDIFNCQNMFAVGLMQSKEPLKPFPTCKASACSAVGWLISHSFGICKGNNKVEELSPVKKKKMMMMREMYSEMEVVYVGQLCLSWEVLQWEYEKALKIWECDNYGLARYNEVAGEFQRFQVLLQRFIENEPFQGPRVETYLKHRCVMPNLLQVPLVREDKDERRRGRSDGSDNGVTSDMVVEILEESIRTMWRFIRADKHASSFTLAQLQHHADNSELLYEVRADVQKKEKMVSEGLRRGIWKKLEKDEEEDERDGVVYFFAQVDLKLVWRVLRMRKITKDQLAWCRSKLNKISFQNGRIHIEPSFLLFPSS